MSIGDDGDGIERSNLFSTESLVVEMRDSVQLELCWEPRGMLV
jgi:hypothetical protein